MFAKRVKMLDIMTKGKVFSIMIDLECHDLIHLLFQCFLTEITKHHPGNVKACMHTTISLILDKDDEISK